MELNNDDLKFNFGCASCGYKDPHGHIDTERMLSKLDQIFDKNDLFEAERLLKFWQGEAINLNDKKGELTILNELVGLYRRTKDSQKSEQVIDKALQIIRELGIENNLSTATIFLNIATNINSFGNAEKSLSYYLKTLEIYKQNLDSNDKLFGSFYNNYASALANTGRFDEAKDTYIKAISIMEGLPNAKPETAISYINVSYVYDYLNDKTSISECMDKAYKYLIDESNNKDGNYYFELSKCIEPFRERGYTEIADKFQSEITSFYNSNK